MTDGFGIDLAEELTDYFTEGADIPPAESTYYVALYDGTGTEVTGSTQNGRVALATTDISEVNSTELQNDIEINFGEATADITVQEAALKDVDDTDANARILLSDAITDAPQDYASGTRVFIGAGNQTWDFLE